MMDTANRLPFPIEKPKRLWATPIMTIAALWLAAVVLPGGLRQTVAADVRYEIKVQKDVMVPMRDGVKLATDIYLPAKDGEPVDGRFPVVLIRTPVRLFVMGTGDGHKTETGKLYHGGYWRDEADYPLPHAKPTNYYLQPDLGLATTLPSPDGASTTFQFDPDNPVPTVGGCVVGSGKLMMDGAWNQWGGKHTWSWPVSLPLSARNDVVVFTTPPLEKDMEVIGPIRVKLWASSSAVDTDFTAKLIDVYPSSKDFPAGFDLIMGDGILRARYRDSDKKETLMVPGKIYEFDIKLDPCSNVFKKGHRIRVDISSSNFPRFDVNPNTGEPPNDYRRKVTATNTIYCDKAHPSHIVLPVVPNAG